MYFPSTGKSGVGNRPAVMRELPFIFPMGEGAPVILLYGWRHAHFDIPLNPYPFSITVTFMTQCWLAPSTYSSG
jgi:hypothetical protein